MSEYIIINYGRIGTWYEDAKGKAFKVLDKQITSAGTELIVELNGYLDGLFGIHPKRAMITNSDDTIDGGRMLKNYEIMARTSIDEIKLMRTNNIETAIKMWVRLDNKYPTMVGLWTTEYNAKKLIDYCIDNSERVASIICDLYTNRVVDPYNIIRGCNISDLASKTLSECSTEESSVDEVFPFSRG